MGLVLGIENAKVVATLANRSFTYELPLTNSNGRQIEDYETLTKRVEGVGDDPDNPEIEFIERVKGYRIYWTFSHADFIEGSDVEVFNSILTRHKQGYNLRLTPRSDEEWRYFDVIPDNQTLSLGINSGGYTAMNNSWVFRFVTKRLEPDLKLQVAEEATAGGFILTFN